MPDVTEADFQREVVDRSHEIPAAVGFGRRGGGRGGALTSVLERGLAAPEGKLVLAEVPLERLARLRVP